MFRSLMTVKEERRMKVHISSGGRGIANPTAPPATNWINSNYYEIPSVMTHEKTNQNGKSKFFFFWLPLRQHETH